MFQRPAHVVILGGFLLIAAGCAAGRPTAEAPPPMPAAPAEVKTAQPGPGYVWIPGHYDYRSSDRSYVWVPGTWIVPPTGQTWVPGHWETRPEGSRWVAGHWSNPSGVIAQAPAPPAMPAPPPEVRTAQPGSGYVWIPGHYEWRASDRSYVWVPGSWTVPPDGQTWVPGRWENRPEGSVWVESHWQRS